MANLTVSGPQADYKRGMANQMMHLLRTHGHFEAIPEADRARYSKITELDEFARPLVVIKALPPLDLRTELRDLESRGFLPPLPSSALLNPKRENLGHGRENTMDGFWKQMRWFIKDEVGRITLTPARWQDSPVEVHYSAVRYLYMRVLAGKDPRQACRADFENNKLRSLLRIHNNNVHELVSGAFPELNIMPWEMPNARPRNLQVPGK